jgi:ankyrin repeat protein
MLVLSQRPLHTKLVILEELLKVESFRKSINVADAKGITPLMVACFHFAAPLVRLLIDKGANLLAVDSSGTNALMAALMQPSLLYPSERAMYDLEPPSLGSASFAPGPPPLSALAVISELEKDPVAFEALVNARNADGLTPVHLACSRLECNQAVIDALLAVCKQNLSEPPRAHRGNTPLHMAAIQGNSQVVKVRCVLFAYGHSPVLGPRPRRCSSTMQRLRAASIILARLRLSAA